MASNLFYAILLAKDEVALLLGLIFHTARHSCRQMLCAEDRRTFKEKKWRGSSKFISLENLANPAFGYLASDNLKLRVHFEVGCEMSLSFHQHLLPSQFAHIGIELSIAIGLYC